ncbi:MAG: acetate kinase [Phycisphaerales bacterium]|nr:MAG: acetate kinase [Phycisphaerales bacterium]
MKVLVINAGSSSVKYHLYQMPHAEVLASGYVERIGEQTSELSHSSGGQTCTRPAEVRNVARAMELIFETLVDEQVGVLRQVSEIDAVGHRVVHGGEEFTGSVIIDEKVIASIEKFADLAPLHNPPNLDGILAAQCHLPDAKQVACFDTAFHATIPEVAYMYALPYELYQKYGIRRYGFHGISHRYVARRAAALMGRGKYDINAITCHLGNGCSVTAVKNGRSIDTSMGLTPLEGVPMGTRSGDLDPAILFYLADKGYDVNQMKDLCNKHSGLLGISGVSNDVRNLEELAEKDHTRARLAIDVFCYRIKKYIGAYAVVMDNVDAIVFTGGIGEHAVLLRERICNTVAQIGVRLDHAANRAAVATEAEISTADSEVKVFVIPTNEQAAIANDTYELANRRERGPASCGACAGRRPELVEGSHRVS